MAPNNIFCLKKVTFFAKKSTFFCKKKLLFFANKSTFFYKKKLLFFAKKSTFFCQKKVLFAPSTAGTLIPDQLIMTQGADMPIFYITDWILGPKTFKTGKMGLLMFVVMKRKIIS